MQTRFFAAGAAMVAVAIAGGALGAHALRPILDANALGLWRTAFHYVTIAGLGLLAVGLAAEIRPRRMLNAAGLALGVGGSLFGATVAALALGGPRWLGAVTPLGGLLMIAGFSVAAVATWRR